MFIYMYISTSLYTYTCGYIYMYPLQATWLLSTGRVSQVSKQAISVIEIKAPFWREPPNGLMALSVRSSKPLGLGLLVGCLFARLGPWVLMRMLAWLVDGIDTCRIKGSRPKVHPKRWGYSSPPPRPPSPPSPSFPPKKQI